MKFQEQTLEEQLERGSSLGELQAADPPMVRAALLDMRRRARTEGREDRRVEGRLRRRAATRVVEWACERIQLRRSLRRLRIPAPVQAWGVLPSGRPCAQVNGHWLQLRGSELRRVGGDPVRGASDLIGLRAPVVVPAMSEELGRALRRTEEIVLQPAPGLGGALLVMSLLTALIGFALTPMGMIALLPWFIAGVCVWVSGAILDSELTTSDLSYKKGCGWKAHPFRGGMQNARLPTGRPC